MGDPLSPAFSARSRLVREGTLRVQLAGLGFVERQGIGREEFVEGKQSASGRCRPRTAFQRLSSALRKSVFPMRRSSKHLMSAESLSAALTSMCSSASDSLSPAQQGRIGILQIAWKKGEQGLFRRLLHRAVGAADIGVIIFDRRGRSPVSVSGASWNSASTAARSGWTCPPSVRCAGWPAHGLRPRSQCYARSDFPVVCFASAPTVDIFHARKHGEKFGWHFLYTSNTTEGRRIFQILPKIVRNWKN